MPAMATDTGTVIERLVGDLRPIDPLRSPVRRTLTWLAIALPFVAAIVVAFGLRPDLGIKVTDPRYIVEQAAALATALLAAWAAFSMTVPGCSRSRIWLPLVPLAIWIGVVTEGCVEDFYRRGWAGMPFQADWLCLPIIALVGSWPAIVMVVMLRRGAPLHPHRTVAMGALASAGLANVALRLFHAQDVSLTVLVWQVGTALSLAWLGSRAGPVILRWRTDLVRSALTLGQRTQKL